MNNQGAYKASVSTIDLSPSGKLIAAGYDDGTIRQGSESNFQVIFLASDWSKFILKPLKESLILLKRVLLVNILQRQKSQKKSNR